LGVSNPCGITPPLNVRLTFLPRTTAPKSTKILNKIKEPFFFIRFPPQLAAKEGAIPLAPIFMEKNMANKIRKIQVKLFSFKSPSPK
jgi:hypothetical protein